MTNVLLVESKLFWWLLVGFAGLLGGYFMNRTFYVKSVKQVKSLYIPPVIFGLVWVVLYVLQASATMLRQFNADNIGYVWSLSLTLYVIALFVGVSFMPLFFKMQSYLLGFLSLVASWGLHLTVLIMFFQEYIVSGWLMLPTQIWLTIALFYFCNIWYINYDKKWNILF
jgi:tryptophan-rich sensory protein